MFSFNFKRGCVGQGCGGVERGGRVACGELALVESFSKMPYFQLGGLSNETRKREDCLAYVQRKRVPEKLCVLLKELL